MKNATIGKNTLATLAAIACGTLIAVGVRSTNNKPLHQTKHDQRQDRLKSPIERFANDPTLQTLAAQNKGLSDTVQASADLPTAPSEMHPEVNQISPEIWVTPPSRWQNTDDPDDVVVPISADWQDDPTLSLEESWLDAAWQDEFWQPPTGEYWPWDEPSDVALYVEPPEDESIDEEPLP